MRAGTDHVCGYSDTTTGKPCENQVSGPDEYCWIPSHTDAPDADQENPQGRPSKYEPELAETILMRLAGGETLRQICRDDAIPVAHPTVLDWVRRDVEDFSDRYARARSIQCDVLFDRHLEIAQGHHRDLDPASDSHILIQRDKLVADALKWRISKVKPDKYGRRVEHRHGGMDDAPPVQIVLPDNQRGHGEVDDDEDG